MNTFYSKEEVESIVRVIDNHSKEGKSFLKDENLFAIRQLLNEVPELKKLLFNDNLKELLPEDCFLTKAIYFDKPGNSNWFVPLHQDLSISVNEKIELEGYKNWTNKRGQIGVEPPTTILENIITVRIHLDDTDEKNGALSIIPESHLRGVKRVETLEKKSTQICAVKKGGVMLMKPLTFHSSKKSIDNRNRRVIHLEFSNQELKEPLQWLEKTSLN